MTDLRLCALSVLMIGLLLSCGKEPAEMKVRKPADVAEEVEQASREVLRLAELDAKIAEAGTSQIDCGEQHAYQARHPWSMWGVPFDDLERAMSHLRAQLPQSGWRIVKDGPDNSQAQNRQLVANSKDGRLSLDLSLMDRRDRDGESILAVTVVSRCYRSA